MAKMHVLTAPEITQLFSKEQTLFFFMKEKKRLRNDKFDAIGIVNYANAQPFLTQYFRGDAEKAQEYTAASITLKNPTHLFDFFSQCHLKNIYIADMGILSFNKAQDAMQQYKIEATLAHKLDNEHFYWIGFSNGSSYKQDGALCLYLRFHEAQQQADAMGGHLGTFTIVEPLCRDCFVPDEHYYIEGMLVKGHIIKNACQSHFNKTMLPFAIVKEYIDQGLSVFAGQNAWDEFELFKYQGFSSLFSPKASRNLIHPLVQQALPDDSAFFPIQKREALYEVVDTMYISFDCMYHCTREVFENAIMGKDNYKDWPEPELAHKTQELFNTTYLYIILSRENYNERTRTSFPSIINSARKRVWLFEDYGKALNFCQQKERFIDSDMPAIGLLTSATEGWDLHNILSLLLTRGVEDIELNPLEEDRMLLPIRFMLRVQNLQPLNKDAIKRIQLDTSDEKKDAPWIFNDILLA